MYRVVICILVAAATHACTHINSFPMTAKSGDTISLMVGGSEKVRKDTIAITLTDTNGTAWDMQTLGLIRSVFNVRPDGRAKGLYSSSELEANLPWAFGHEPIQTIVVLDLPTNLPEGVANFDIYTNTNDNSSGVGQPFSMAIDIVAGSGNPDSFDYRNNNNVALAAQLEKLEAAPYAKISFGTNKTETLAAATLVIDFDETVVSANEIAVYTPKTTARKPGLSFDQNQHELFWKQDGDKLTINLIAATGIKTLYTYVYIMHPASVSSSPNFTILDSRIYDINGNEVAIPVTLEYFP